MRSFLAAVRFFTVLPLPDAWCGEARDLGRGVVYLPLIGLLLGACAVAVDAILQLLFPPSVSAVMDVAVLLLMTGALHLDGLADTADGFLSARPPERILEIMRDSRVGAMGVLAVTVILGAKVAALASLPLALRPTALLLMPLAGRCAILWMEVALPYMRRQGMDFVFQGHCTASYAGWTAALFVGVVRLAAGRAGVTVYGAVFGATWAMIAWCRRKIGGKTGDTLGASSEVAELAVVLALSSWAHLGGQS